jgi:hypothetical protein
MPRARDNRHSFSTIAQSGGVPKDDRAYLMGHSAGDVEAAHYRVVQLPSLYEQVKKLPDLVTGDQGFGHRFGHRREPSRDQDQKKAQAARRAALEVRTGFEPAYDGFANHCLATWLPHQGRVGFLARLRADGSPKQCASNAIR